MKVYGIATLTRDPESRYATSGTAIVGLGLAGTRKWKGQGGEPKEESSFFDATAFGKTGETIAQYFKKGSKIFIEGRLKQESWDDKQTGQKRSAVKIIVESFEFCGGKREESSDRPVTPAPTRPSAARQPDEVNDDVPF